MAAICNAPTILNILHTRVGIPLDTPNINTASWDELGVESLGLTEVCSSLERQLAIDIPHEEALTTKSVQDLVAFINSIQK